MANNKPITRNTNVVLIYFYNEVEKVNILWGILGAIGSLFGVSGLTLEGILGIVFSPLAFAIGVPWHEAVTAGGFIGQKLIVNEFVAYLSFAPQIGELSEKTVAVVSFALCGFANFSSLAILLGGLGNLAPNRRADIAKLGLRAVAAGMLASLLSGSVAGMLF
nr:nucleoside transporter C-terminal domain-containing protein [Alkalihalobacillus sp. BA299]